MAVTIVTVLLPLLLASVYSQPDDGLALRYLQDALKAGLKGQMREEANRHKINEKFPGGVRPKPRPKPPIDINLPNIPDTDHHYEIVTSRDKSQNTSYVFNHYFNSVIPSYFSSSLYCSDASSTTSLLLNRIRTNGSLEQVKEVALNDCLVTRQLPRHQCNGFVERYIPTLYYIVKRRPYLSQDTVVSTFFQSVGCGNHRFDQYMEWNLPINPPIRVNHRNINKTRPVQQSRNHSNSHINTGKYWSAKAKSGNSGDLGNYVKILQLTDINLDLYYQEGSSALCEGFGPCCELDSGVPSTDNEKAGVYGDGRKCDSPDTLVDKALEQISRDHPDTDIVLLSGDYGAHDQWRSTQGANTDIIRYVSKLVAYYFPTSIIVPILGDQEVHPAHQFSPAGESNAVSTQWIYKVTQDLWKAWIPRDQLSTWLVGGYYFLQLGNYVKIIVLNSNVCYERNLWQMYQVKDPLGQLDWLQKELHKSEAQKQNVYIVGHVPPASIGCTKVWSRNYHNIVARYQDTIKAQIFGHESQDTFHVFYKPRSQVEPLAVQFVAPSFSPRYSNNPSYRIYYANQTTWDLIDLETYTFDLKAANRRAKEEDPKWLLLYRFTEAYKVKDLTPDTMSKLVRRLALDDDLFSKYLQYREKSLEKKGQDACDAYCRKTILCGMVTPYLGEDAECQAIQRQHDGIVVPIYNIS